MKSRILGLLAVELLAGPWLSRLRRAVQRIGAKGAMRGNRAKAMFCVMVTASFPCQSGVIAPNGNEWELRGTVAFYGDHVDAAAADVGWNWATSSEWYLSGLDGLVLNATDKEAFEGACNLNPRNNCYGWLADVPFEFVTGSGLRGRQVFTGEGKSDQTGSWTVIVNAVFSEDYRVAYRIAEVSEPGTLALLGLSLAGLGLSRRRKAN